jgi:hypothetical protein
VNRGDDGLRAVAAHRLLQAITQVQGTIDVLLRDWDRIPAGDRLCLLRDARARADELSEGLEAVIRGWPAIGAEQLQEGV